MNENLTEEQKEELRKIDERIDDLRQHQSMWAKAGGMGGSMAIKAMGEIEDLEIKKKDIVNGTNNYKIITLGREIAKLKSVRRKATLLEKFSLSSEIRKRTRELNDIQQKGKR